MDSPAHTARTSLFARRATPVIATLALLLAVALAIAAFEHQVELRDAARAVERHSHHDTLVERLRTALISEEIALHEAFAHRDRPIAQLERPYRRARAEFGRTLPALQGILPPAELRAIAAAHRRYVRHVELAWSALAKDRISAALRHEHAGEPLFDRLNRVLFRRAERLEQAGGALTAELARREHSAVTATALAAAVGIAIFSALGFLLLRTERRRSKLALAAAEGHAMRAAAARFRSLVEGMPCVSYVAERGPSGRWHFVSPQIEGLLGYSASEWVADPELWARSIHPDDADWVVAYDLENWAEVDEEVTAEYRMVARDGATVWVSDSAVPFVAEDGAPAWYGVLFDVSERKAAEAELMRTRIRLEEAQALAQIGSFEYVFEASRLTGSPEFAAITGLDPSREPWPLNHLLRLLPAARRAEALRGMRALAAGSSLEAEWELTRPDGATRSVRLLAQRVGDERPARAIGTLQDVTDLRTAERERAELERALAHSQRLESVGQLAGGIAHEFNNLLTVISNSAAFLERDTDEDDPRREDLRQISGACERASTLTRQMLAFGRKEIVQPEPVDLGALVADSEPLLRRALGERIALVFASSDRACVVSADVGQMQQVLLNLALNARDAMPDGGTLAIELAADVDAPAPRSRCSQRWVALTVSDDGCGMAPEVAAQAFDPFFTTKPRATGTGLGLSTVHGIVSQAGGTIALESVPGHGTSFRIVLPATDLSGAPSVVADGEKTTGTEPLTSGDGGVVLVVDDQDSLREVVARMLERRGYEVCMARNGRHALEVLRRHPGEIDLVLTDVVMPELSGPELALELGPEGPPVVFMSGYIDDPAVRELVEVRRIQVLQKPFATEELIAVVAGALGRRGTVVR